MVPKKRPATRLFGYPGLMSIPRNQFASLILRHPNRPRLDDSAHVCFGFVAGAHS